MLGGKKYHYGSSSHGIDVGFEEDPEILHLIYNINRNSIPACDCCFVRDPYIDDPEDIKKILKANPYNISKIDVSSTIIDDDLIEYIAKVDVDGFPGCREKIIKHLVKSNLTDFRDVMLLAKHESLDYAVRRDPLCVSTHLLPKLRNEKYWMTILKYDVRFFCYIPDASLTEEMCERYLKYEPCLDKIPERLRTDKLRKIHQETQESYINDPHRLEKLTQEMYDAFIEKNPYQRLDYIPLSDKSLKLLAENNPNSLRCITLNKINDEIINTFIRNFPSHFVNSLHSDYHKYLSTDTWKFILEFNPESIKHISNEIREKLLKDGIISDEIWLKAIAMDASLIAYIPERLITQEMSTKAVLRNWNNIENIPIEHITPPMVRRIIREGDYDVITKLPAELFPEDCNFGFLYF